MGAVFRATIPDGFTSEDNLFVANLSVDCDFLETYDMKLIAGRPFSREFGSDPSSGFIVNATAVTEFNWESPEQAMGKKIVREGRDGEIVGVISDFNFSLAGNVQVIDIGFISRDVVDKESPGLGNFFDHVK